MSLQKKVAAISQKIDALKAQQLELEKTMSEQLFDLIKAINGFSVPFPTLVGAIIESIAKSKNDSKKSEEWHLAGEKFLKAKSKSTK
jgi:hypothetical protein